MPIRSLVPGTTAPPVEALRPDAPNAGRSGRRRLELCPSAELAVAAQGGDNDAAGELYRRVSGRARRAASAFCHDADADDAVAEGLSRALGRIRQLHDPAAVEPWMVRCVVRSAIDLSRQRRRQAPTDALDGIDGLIDGVIGPGESAAEGAMSVLERHEMSKAVLELRSDLRLLLYLRYEAGLSVQHIAVALGKPAGTVRRQCVEARRQAGQRFLCRHLRPAAGDCARVTDVLCQQHYRRPPTRVRRRTVEHLRRCPGCRERQSEVAAVLTEMGYRGQTRPASSEAGQQVPTSA